ncbi:hypothetical protein COL922a_011436 [Colletotrichum nupharicola]|nr:hypothetical protein COL922a_011436 [Colletotrichum nupharicola]
MNYYLYKQDIARLAAVGVQSYSFSISWSRIVPFGKAGSPINKEAIDHYSDLIDTVISYGMKPVATLYHFDTTATLQSNTSFFSYDHPDFINSFVYYAQTVLVYYSDRVGTWYTFNEPTIEPSISGSWVTSRYILEAHAKVVRWYRDVVKGGALWSMKFDLTDTGFALPLDPSNASDVAAAVRRNNFTVGYFARPLFFGENPPQSMIDTAGEKVPTYTDEELEFSMELPTSLPLTFTLRHIIPSQKKASPLPSRTRGLWEPNFQGNPDRIAVPAEHVRAMLGFWQAKYPTKGGITIAEFGLPAYKAANMSTEHIQNDLAQSNFYIPILAEVLKAINLDNIHVKGLYGWSFLDNWEWGQYNDKYGVQGFNATTPERFYKRAIFDYAGFIQDHMEE